ncbi:hypothetical protein H4J46_02345 [Colwellia sp. MB02u-6]|jgi:hypothetical protein|uniref:hypothetical protein n=1 Tax=Colwellia sp. MB02u-6 TaxID=2759824 RepID=UPI0015F4F18C|nr:hypothetical protein [Colwellia sp. MB02u-6]MBA6326792.1 hypothetical protein [Colwellia sp. MB02u-6]
MKIILALLCLLSLSSSASECNISPNVISAYYQLSTQVANSKRITKPVQQLFELHRNNNTVLQRNVSAGINDIWLLNGNRLSLNRAFEMYQHTIEYQPNELRHQPQWQDAFQLVMTPEKHQMQLIEQKNSGCLLEQHFVLKGKHGEYQLTWLPKLQLVKFFQVKDTELTRQWQLTKFQPNAEQTLSLLKKYASYQSTDYADIGDNEGIPFLATMINQGFSMPGYNRPALANKAHQH